MIFDGNKHYIDVDSQGRIVDGWSDGPHPQRQPTDQSVLLTDRGGYQFRLPVSEIEPSGEIVRTMSEENPSLWTMDGIPLYKYEDGEVLPRTEEEISAGRAAIPEPPPTAQEQLRADVDFLAAMQGVSL